MLSFEKLINANNGELTIGVDNDKEQILYVFIKSK